MGGRRPKRLPVEPTPEDLACGKLSRIPDRAEERPSHDSGPADPWDSRPGLTFEGNDSPSPTKNGTVTPMPGVPSPQDFHRMPAKNRRAVS